MLLYLVGGREEISRSHTHSTWARTLSVRGLEMQETNGVEFLEGSMGPLPACSRGAPTPLTAGVGRWRWHWRFGLGQLWRSQKQRKPETQTDDSIHFYQQATRATSRSHTYTNAARLQACPSPPSQKRQKQS